MKSAAELCAQVNNALEHPDPEWAFHFMLDQEARDSMDRMIVRDDLGNLFEQASTQEQRFKCLHKNSVKFDANAQMRIENR